jgi:hypothetical protein
MRADVDNLPAGRFLYIQSAAREMRITCVEQLAGGPIVGSSRD